MAEPEPESLVMRRPRRSTAGNRMEAALAEFKAEELGQDAEEDNDFVVEVDEQDAFGSDFESTDEEGAQEEVDNAAERMVQEEEKKARKAGRSQLDRVTAAAHARNKATFQPQLVTTAKPVTAKAHRHVSLGAAVDAETGAVLKQKRKSLRRYTMLNTSLTETRAKGEQEKKSALPRRLKVKAPPPTQSELIARALDMEDGNIKEHRNYLKMEEEKRKRARVIRTAVEGPLVRWISRIEEVSVPVTAPPAPTQPVYPLGSTTYAPPTQHTYPQVHSSNQLAPVPESSYAPYTPYPPVSYTPYPIQGSSQMTFVYQSFPPSASPTPNPASQPSTQNWTSPSTVPLETTEKVTKNYVIHETSQKEGASKPRWKETMAALFGDHVQWDELKVYVGKGRPLSRPKDICPLTGKVARYRDPRTGVPFASVQAYQTLTKVLEHDFVWSEDSGCYVAARADFVEK